MKNRRNYYRLLCVQPDAPPAVIRSSYTALMVKLKRHPDLGGDHETATLLNEAYAVLSDPARRAEYDQQLEHRQSRASLGRGAFQSGRRGAPATPAAPSDTHTPPLPPQAPASASRVRCAFCAAPHPGAVRPGDRCALCDSPLLSPMHVASSGRDQRALPRLAHGGQVTLVTQRSAKRVRATIQDLSPLGMQVVTGDSLRVDEVVKVDCGLLSAVARVASCRHAPRPGTGSVAIGLEFLTLDLTAPRGAFVSTRT
jgi:hypothetical protein